MEDAIREVADAAERAAATGLPFSLKAFVYFEGEGVVQVLRHECEGGVGDWHEVIGGAIDEALPDQDGAVMLRWMIEFPPVAGNHKVGDRSGA